MKKSIYFLIISPSVLYAQYDSVFSVSFDVIKETYYQMPATTKASLDNYDKLGLMPSYSEEHHYETVGSDGRSFTDKRIIYPVHEFEDWIKKPARIFTDYDSTLMYDSSGNVMYRNANRMDCLYEDSASFVTYYYASPLFQKLSDSAVMALVDYGYTINANNDSIVWYITDSTSDFYDLHNLVYEYSESKGGESKFISTTVYTPGENQDLVYEYVIEKIPYNWHGKCMNKIFFKHYYNLIRNFYDPTLVPIAYQGGSGKRNFDKNYKKRLYASQQGVSTFLKIGFESHDGKPLTGQICDLYGKIIVDNITINEGVNSITMPEGTSTGIYLLSSKCGTANKVKIIYQYN